MKKVLLFVAAGLFCTSVSADEYPSPAETKGYPVNNLTTTVPAVKLNPGSDDEQSFDKSGTVWATPAYKTEWKGDVLKVTFTLDENSGTHYNPFGISMAEWKTPEGGDASTPKFMISDSLGTPNTLYQSAVGMSVDFTAGDKENAYVSMDVLCDSDIDVRVDVQGVNGTTSNAIGVNAVGVVTATPGATGASADKWQTLTFSWNNDGDASAYGKYDEVMLDTYSDLWLEELVNHKKGTPVHVCDTAIIGISITLDNATKVTKETVKTFYVKNIVIGAGYDENGDYQQPTEYKGYVGIEDVLAPTAPVLESVNGVFYSEGNITVTNLVGQVVTVVANELSIASLPAGTYFVTAAEGAAKIVK